jgi:hypothetical protein
VTAALTLISLTAGLAFIGLMVAALVTTRGDVPIRNLSRALRLYGWAVAMQAIVLTVRVVTANWLWVVVNATTLAIVTYCIRATRQRRDLKAQRVQAEAERTVRDYWRGGIR